jgi:hypothetical protein
MSSRRLLTLARRILRPTPAARAKKDHDESNEATNICHSSPPLIRRGSLFIVLPSVLRLEY